MDRIKIKQVEDAMDLSSSQTVTGAKSFAAPQQFTGGSSIMVAYQNAMYWCQREDLLEEPGNSRLRMEAGALILETYNGSNWVTA